MRVDLSRLSRFPGLAAALVAGLAAGCAPPSPAPADPEVVALDALLELTGARTRVVWVQDIGDGSDFLAHGTNLQLVVADTADPSGKRVLVPGPRNLVKPMFTDDGTRVVFSDRHRERMYIVPVAGGSPTTLGKGFALHTWREPATGVEWLYYTRETVRDGKVLQTHDAVYRRGLPPYPWTFRTLLDRLRGRYAEQVVWNASTVSEDSFQVSADGRFASSVFPWPEAGVLEVEAGHWDQLGRGCWVGLAPDNSYLFWIFDGPHRNLLMHRHRGGDPAAWTVNINGFPTSEGYEVYHPRWSNHPRILAVTGPYKIGEGPNRLAGGGPSVEVHIGRFSPDHTTVETWVQFTDNGVANFYPDVWVDHQHHRPPGAAAAEEQPPPPTPDAWPGSREGLVYLWERLDGQNVIRDGDGRDRYRCRPEPFGWARYSRHQAMLIEQGGFLDREAGATAIRAIATAGAFTLEVTAHPAAEPVAGEALLVAVAGGGGGTPVRIGTGESGVWAGVGGARIESGVPLTTGAVHIALTAAEDRATLYVNGDNVGEAVVGRIAWPDDDPRLVFGAAPDGSSAWRGELDGVALVDRVLEPATLKAHAALRRNARTETPPVDRLVVRGRLAAASGIPSPEDIAPYRRGLITREYEVLEVVEGAYADDLVLVASWVILDGEILPHARRDIGEERVLELEPYDQHPQLEGERLTMDTENLLLDLYLEPEIR